MIYVNVISNTTHLKRNQHRIEVTVAKRVYKYITSMHPIVAACVLTVLSIALRPFAPTTKPVVL